VLQRSHILTLQLLVSILICVISTGNEIYSQTLDTICTPELTEKKILFGLIKVDELSKAEKNFRKHHEYSGQQGLEKNYTINYDSLGLKVSPYVRTDTMALKKEVFGWYPYWDKDLHKSLNYSLLTTVAYFSYEVDPNTGKAKSIHDWNSTPLIDSLKSNRKRSLLTVTNFGKSANKKLLKNNKAINTLIASLKELIKDRADGVCIDFEDIHNQQKNDFSKFITLLRQELDKEDKEYKIYITVPAVDWAKAIDYSALIPIVDQFVIMGYNYYGSESKVAGPVDPICSGDIWEPFNLNSSADYYLEQKIPSTKLIMALPFYGHIWETKTGAIGSAVDRYVGPRTYEYIKAKLGNSQLRIDPISNTAYYSYITTDSRGKNQFRQCWFDTSTTLTSKLEMIREKDLNGLGIWALGYDKGYNDLWERIEEIMCEKRDSLPFITQNGTNNHVTDSSATTSGTNGATVLSPGTNRGATKTTETKNEITDPSFWDKLKSLSQSLQNIKEYQSVLLFALAFLVVFGGAGFLMAMFHPETRMYFFSSRAYTFYYMAFIFLLALFILRWQGVIDNAVLAMVAGFMIGASGIYFVNRYVQKIKRELP